MTEKLAAKRAEKKAAEKAEAKKEAKKEQMEKLREGHADKSENVPEDDDYVILQADSVEELVKKIENYNFSLRADSVQTPYEKSIGQSIDFKG